MSDSLKDQLLGLGFKPLPVASAKPALAPLPRRDAGGSPRQYSRENPRDGGKPAGQGAQSARRDPRTADDGFDLAQAYALRARQEKDERIETERMKQEAARIKREAKARVVELLRGGSLAASDAEHVRHFEYNGKIRRVHVSADQLKALNAGELGVVQLDGRYLLVTAGLAREIGSLLPSLVALLVDPDAPTVDDPHADPRFAVPDDLLW